MVTTLKPSLVVTQDGIQPNDIPSKSSKTLIHENEQQCKHYDEKLPTMHAQH